MADRSSSDAPQAPVGDAADAPAGVCPFPHAAAIASVCPVPHGGASAPATDRTPVERSRADVVVRRLLRVPDRPSHVSEAAANRSFQQSMIISGIRCTLTYILIPFVLPAIGIATRVGPLLGLSIGSVAIVCDVFTIRRFFAADHKWRWHFSALALAVIGLLAVLIVKDIAALT